MDILLAVAIPATILWGRYGPEPQNEDAAAWHGGWVMLAFFLLYLAAIVRVGWLLLH